MTNEQIIEEVAISVYGAAAVEKMKASGMEIPLHTIHGWASRGGPYRVKKGEHGIETRLWKRKKNTAARSEEKKDEEQGTDTHSGFYLCKSYLFRADQIERVEK